YNAAKYAARNTTPPKRTAGHSFGKSNHQSHQRKSRGASGDVATQLRVQHLTSQDSERASHAAQQGPHHSAPHRLAERVMAHRFGKAGKESDRDSNQQPQQCVAKTPLSCT